MSGSNNIANGYNSLYFNTIGSNNIANGYNSLYSKHINIYIFKNEYIK